mmetsp:Transcript_27320/g.42924  ORF Transcript_27320/g.42924 Transcript_27320/m.42924 type:complete len:134 (+) Transcript_27320:69-470(+)
MIAKNDPVHAANLIMHAVALQSYVVHSQLSKPYILPAKLAWSVPPFIIAPPSCTPTTYSGTVGLGHLLVILIRLVKNSIAPSPVISMSPYLDLVPYNPPNEKGSLGTGIPMLTPSIDARTLDINHSACPPFDV